MITNEATPSEKTETTPPLLEAGQKLAGCYLLKKRVMVGDASELWEAHDEVLGKDISLLFIPEKVRRDSKAVAEIRQEIKRNRQLIHPNILRVYDFIEEPDWAAVSMDTFEGESLESLLAGKDSRALAVKELESWVFQLCQTLDDAHKIGLFHRNLSPANICFRPGGGLFLTGFGFSRCLSDAVRRADGVQGPESARISPQLLEGLPPARTDDIYSCGALLHELLAGVPLFSGDDIAEQIRKATPKPIGESRPKELDPVPANWEKAIAACLSKNPAERPPSGGQLAKLLTVATGSESPEPAPVEAVAAAAIPIVVPEADLKSQGTGETKEAMEPPPKQEPASPPFRKRSISTTAEPLVPGSAAPKTTPEKITEKTVPEKAAPSESGAAAKQSKQINPTKTKPVKPDAYQNVYGNRSQFPVRGFAVAVALVVVGFIGYHFIGSHNADSNGPIAVNNPPEHTAGDGTPGEDSTKIHPPVDVVNNPEVSDGKSTDGNTKPPETGDKPPKVIVANTSTPKPVAPNPSANPAVNTLAEKQAALDSAKQAVQAAEKTLTVLTSQRQKADADVAAAQKALDEKVKGLGPAKKVVEKLLAERKKLEDDQKAAEGAAQQAQQVADDKLRLAVAAKQTVEDLTAKNQDKLAALDKADAEILELRKGIEVKQEAASAGVKALAEAEAVRQKQADAVKSIEQQVASAKAAITDAQKDQELREKKKKELEEEMKRMQKMQEDMRKQLQELQEQSNKVESGSLPSGPAPGPAAVATPPVVPSVKPTPKPVATPARATPVSFVPPSTPSELAPLPKPETPDLEKLTNRDGPSVDLNAPPAEVAHFTPGGNVNTLGQKFVPVGDVEFCIWLTRVKDFDVFAKDVNLKSSGWRNPGFKQAPDHPVVNVTWQEAIAFCKWLTDKEHQAGALPPAQFYRLPSDLEWSKAVGLPEELGRTPAERDMMIADVYPWGKEWPPPPGAGNYTGEETQSDVAIKGYNDGFAWTSPVGSFNANKIGLFDMGGNVWQWCMDSWDATSKGKVLRGASWYNGALKLSLLSSCRVHAAPDSSTDNYGFRIIKATEGSRPGKK